MPDEARPPSTLLGLRLQDVLRLLARRLRAEAPRTPREVVSLFLAHGQRGVSPVVQAMRRCILADFLQAVGDKPLLECRPLDALRWADGHSRWRSEWTRSRQLLAVNRPFNWAVGVGLLRRNPFRGASHPAGPPRRPLTMEEFRALLRHGTANSRRVLLFLRFSGCRPGELRALRWEHVDWQRGVAVLPEHKTVRQRRDHAPRVIVLHPVLLRLLRRLEAERRPGQAQVFVNHLGEPWTSASLALHFWQVRDAAGLPNDCTLYGVRHLFGTTGAAKGIGQKVLSELMGHTTTRMTEHYEHLAGQVEVLSEAVQRMWEKAA